MTQVPSVSTNVRSAHAAIAGYEYQFDKTAIALLQADALDQVEIEGIEDVDLHSAGESQAIQVKYFAGQSYVSPKTLREPVRLMVQHFKAGARWNYVLYVHFGDFRSMPDRFTITQLKECLTLSSQTDGVVKYFSGMADADLEDFCSRLRIERGDSFAAQEQKLRTELRAALRCDEDEVVAIYIAKAREFVHSRAMQGRPSVRSVVRQDLLEHLQVKDLLFDKWQMQSLGADRYLAAQKRKLRSGGFNDPRKKRALYVGLGEANIHQILELCVSLGGVHIGRLKSAQPWTVIVDGDSNLVRRLKVGLVQSGVAFNDGHEDLLFQSDVFVRLPIINVRGSGDNIAKASFVLRLVSYSSYQSVDSTTFKISRLVSIGDELPWMGRAAEQVFALRHFEPTEYRHLMEDIA